LKIRILPSLVALLIILVFRRYEKKVKMYF
jgi:hypothetical protein